MLPPVCYSVADWSAGFPGRISLDAQTARATIRDVCLAADRSGLRVALANAHLEPAHVAGLRDACREVKEACGREPAFPDVTRRHLAEQLGEAFRAGDHGGRYETSLVMAARPELVREEIRRALPAVEVSLVNEVKRGAKSFREAGMDRAYCGDPSSASAEEGERLFDILVRLLEESILETFSKG
jgi:creatinine amidohydrolase